MNINALLSPDVSPPPEGSGSEHSSPRKQRANVRPPAGKRTLSSLSQEVSRSPEEVLSTSPSRPSSGYRTPRRTPQQLALPLTTIAETSPAFRVLQHMPASHPLSPLAASINTTTTTTTPAAHGHARTHTLPAVAHRQSSTSHMETLADLASMQQHHHHTQTHHHHQTPPLEPESGRRHAPASGYQSPAPLLRQNPAAPPKAWTRPGKSLADLTMAEAPSQTPPPRNFRSSALSDAESKAVTDLLGYLAENSYAYDSHVQLIHLLHKGFVAHVHPPTGAEDPAASIPQEPRTYGLLVELRQAREAMDSRFAVGESIWLDWLADEALLAASGEERIAVTEQFQKAVNEEPASVRLWQAYVDWVSSNYAACHDLEGADRSGWVEEDKELCKELFNRDELVNVLEQAIAVTGWSLDESHLLWNRYAALAQEDLAASPSAPKFDRVRGLFFERLQVPHAEWSETAQMFWPILNQYDSENWESAMAQINEMAEPAKRQMALREAHELGLQQAMSSGDQEATFDQFRAYLKWERNHRQKFRDAAFDHHLHCALYERALLRFPTYTDWWLDYVDVQINSNPTTSLLPLLERATRHCPWSGDLWAKRLLRSDVEQNPHFEIEAIKHRATNSGLLDVGGMEELLKVLQQWCSYLRRHAFKKNSSEDDLDTAEVAITMAIEDIQQAGKIVYGNDFHGDPLYRLETIQIKFLTEGRRMNDAREIYKGLVPLHKHEYQFWATYYTWELWLWGYDRMTEPQRIETSQNGPDRATAVLQEALSQKDLDFPEKLREMYLNHFQQHESGERLQSAIIRAREFSKHLATRRAKEAELADAEAVTQQQQHLAPAPAQESGANTGGKRKANDEVPNGDSHKKTKIHVEPATGAGLDDASSLASAQIKRDREHNTMTVRNLPFDVTELDIRKFFRDVGEPKSISVINGTAGGTATATVEFESHEDCLAAKTRDGREMHGQEVRIASGSQTTLYVANYPAEYDESAMRSLFDGYGEILSVRFPSLKFNHRRRFCYVSFLAEDMARAAEEALDNKMLDKQHKLVARISNPEAAQKRSGATAEGRELFVRNIDFHVPEPEVKDFFGQYGDVISINLLKRLDNKRTGNGFVVFSGADEAAAALAANHKPFHDRILHVELSTPKGGAASADKVRKTDVLVKPSGSPAPAGLDDANGRRGSDVSMSSAPAGPDSLPNARERKIAIFHLPDTVNDARIRAAMAPYGALVKIQLRRRDHGAIVEFADVQAAFNVRQGVDCRAALGPDVETGDVGDLLAKVHRRQHGPGVGAAAAAALRPPTLSRPGLPRGGGRRGGLGLKRGGASAGPMHGAEGEAGERSGGPGLPAAAAAAAAAAGPKSNADFRSMLTESRGGAEA